MSRRPARSSERPSKVCASCGRAMHWRKAWAEVWDEVRYCSAACRKRKLRPIDIELEQRIEALARRRGPHKSLCPSEVARSLKPDDWRPLMDPTRRAARRLVAAGRVEILQGGRAVDPSTAKGPIRIRLLE